MLFISFLLEPNLKTAEHFQSQYYYLEEEEAFKLISSLDRAVLRLYFIVQMELDKEFRAAWKGLQSMRTIQKEFENNPSDPKAQLYFGLTQLVLSQTEEPHSAYVRWMGLDANPEQGEENVQSVLEELPSQDSAHVRARFFYHMYLLHTNRLDSIPQGESMIFTDQFIRARFYSVNMMMKDERDLLNSFIENED